MSFDNLVNSDMSFDKRGEVVNKDNGESSEVVLQEGNNYSSRRSTFGDDLSSGRIIWESPEDEVNSDDDNESTNSLSTLRSYYRNSEREVYVNGQLIPDDVVDRAKRLAGPIDPGSYWYDPKGGFWGVMGHPCQGILPPGIEEISFPMPEDCSDGDTTVYVNGRELHKIDLDLLANRGLPTTRNKRYIIDISGKVLENPSEEFVMSLGKIAPTVERLKRGFGMRVPENSKISRWYHSPKNSTSASPDSPYQIRMTYRENISSYVYRLSVAIENFHLNALQGVSDFNTPERQAHILIETLPESGPLGNIKRKYGDTRVCGEPNYSRYTYKGEWFLTLGYLEKIMMDVVQEQEYNEGFFMTEFEGSYEPSEDLITSVNRQEE